MPTPAMYVGTIRHRRFAPCQHAFTYSICMAFLDVDRLAELMRVSWFTSYNRRNWASFDDRDHFGDPSRRLRDRLQESARHAGLTLPDGPVFLLTHLRYCGYVFNPISLFYCYDAAGSLRSVLAEVNNTYGGRHLYWLESGEAPGTAPFRATAAKMLYVSPFMEIDTDYHFTLTAPGDRLVAHMNVRPSHGRSPRARIMDATLALSYRPWTAESIHAALVRFPLMTTKVIAAIHWQALRLYLGGLAVVPRRVPNGEGERRAAGSAPEPGSGAAVAKESR